MTDLDELYLECKIDAEREAWMENTPRCENCGEYMDVDYDYVPYGDTDVRVKICICPNCG